MKVKTFLQRVFGDREEIDRSSSTPRDLIGIAQTEEFVDDAGVVQQRIVFKTDYTPDRNLTVKDFCLNNLIAAGVELRQVASLQSADIHAADVITSSVESPKN